MFKYLLLLVLVGCASTPPSKIVIKVFTDHAALNEACDSRPMATTPAELFARKPVASVSGCTKTVGDICFINVMPNAGLEIIDHERRHCFEGAFHERGAMYEVSR